MPPKRPAAQPRRSKPLLLVRPIGLVDGTELAAAGAATQGLERLRIALRPAQVDAMDHYAQVSCQCTLLAKEL